MFCYCREAMRVPALPTSPRKRRRLARLGLAVVVALAALLTVLVIPNRTPPPDHFSNEPADLLSNDPAVKLTKADRRGIDATLDRFVSAAVQRHDPQAAWSISGPGLRADTTRADWTADDMPVYPYPARGSRFHGWVLNFARKDVVSLDILLQPRAGAKVGPIAFSASLLRRHAGWVVNGWYPAATFSQVDEPAKVVARVDYAPPIAKVTTGEPRLGAVWLLLPAGLVGLFALVPVWFLVSGRRRTRRAGQTWRGRSGERLEMPALPTSLRKPGDAG